MELLNDETADKITGGGKFECNKAGDTVACAPLLGKVIACALELNCTPSFSSKCDTSDKVTISGCTTVTIS